MNSMKQRIFFLFFSLLLAINLSFAGNTDPNSGFKIGTGNFLLDGKPFVVKAAELHYPRIPETYWEHRIKMCKALGMNTICLYVFWNAHEQKEGEFDFTGNNDIRRFIELCAKHDMKVILRPGPYVCAEWEMGGLPWWLLKKEDIKLRENDPYFLDKVDQFQKQLFQQIGDLTDDKGGPIIMIQVENEYGSYGENKEYISNIRDILKKYYGNNIAMFQCDWNSNFEKNGLDDLLWTMNFGTGADIDSQFNRLKELRPDSPLMCSEFWSGWFDKWGAKHETRPADDMISGISEMLDKGISFSLYMTHGGTNWGHWAGANSPGFAPDVTSYDYDAPINETGEPTPKYHLLRNLLAKHSEGKLPRIPASIPTMSIPEFELTEFAPLFPNLKETATDSAIKPMEMYNQGFGSINYHTELPSLPGNSKLIIKDIHDYGQIFLNGKFIGKIDRRLGEYMLALPSTDSVSTLDIFVEAMGRINFGRAIKDYKGITDMVVLTENINGKTEEKKLANWTVSLMPDKYDYYRSLTYYPTGAFKSESNENLPRGVYFGELYLEKTNDTFFDMTEWGKGLLYVNGHPIGRFWNIGPQQTLYVPGAWLNKGRNEVMVVDIVGPQSNSIKGESEPILDSLKTSELNSENKDVDKYTTLFNNYLFENEFPAQNGWKEVALPSSEGRYLCLELIDTHKSDDEFAIAEIYLLDQNNERIPRENWKTVYVNSQETTGNHTLEKAFDLQESTYWQSSKKDTDVGNTDTPKMIIDMGKSYNVRSIQYLPRMEQGTPGNIKKFRFTLLPYLPE